jgi:hypothetical protein
MARPSTGSEPEILTLKVASATPRSWTTPTVFSPEAAARAIDKIGRDGYSVLRTKAFRAVAGQRSGIEVVLAPLERAIARRDTFAAGTLDWAQAAEVCELLGNETHWHAINRVGQAVESLCALIAAMEAYRSGAAPAEVSRQLIRHDLNLQPMLRGKRQRKLAFWEQLGARPQLGDLTSAGLSQAEAKALLAAARGWAGQMLRDFQKLSRFYTNALHQIYAKYRHGYTLVSPGLSPLYFEEELAPAVQQSIRRSFVVMHEDEGGRRVVHVVKTGVPEIRLCLDVARFALEITRKLAVAWIIELEHPEGRTLAFDTSALRVARRWFGTSLDEFYDLGAATEPVEEPSAEAAAENTS